MRGVDKHRDELRQVVVELQDVEHVHKQREPRALRQHAEADRETWRLRQPPREAKGARAVAVRQRERKRLGVKLQHLLVINIRKAKLHERHVVRIHCRSALALRSAEAIEKRGHGACDGAFQADDEKVVEQVLGDGRDRHAAHVCWPRLLATSVGHACWSRLLTTRC